MSFVLLSLAGCADETTPQPPELRQTSKATAEQAQSARSYAMPVCGSGGSPRGCNTNEASSLTYAEIEDPYFAAWIEYLRAWKSWEDEFGQHDSFNPTLTVKIAFALGSRAGETFEGTADVGVPAELNDVYWTDGTTVRVYIPTVMLTAGVLGIPSCSLWAAGQCQRRRDTLSLLGLSFEARDPQSSQVQQLPSAQQIDATWVTTEYLVE